MYTMKRKATNSLVYSFSDISSRTSSFLSVLIICGDTIKENKLINAKISHELIDMETLRSKIPNVM